MSTPGRHCPLAYRYAPEMLGAAPEAARAEVLYVVGGLYGNHQALDAIEALAEAERQAEHRVRLIFNGDFNWFNIDPAAFAALNQRVLAHTATLGNVEWELVDPNENAGCGCAYPETVEQGVVDRSNRIIQRLRAAVRPFPELTSRLRQCPRHLCLELAGRRILILHGDPESLAGWGLAREALADPGHHQTVVDWFHRTGADVIACTHTCLPALWQDTLAEHPRVVINNGSAGMGNFRDDPRGLITRISQRGRHPQALYGTTVAGLTVEALPVAFDLQRWLQQFQAWWPPGSDAELSYGPRIRRGTAVAAGEAKLGPDARYEAR